MALNYSAAYNPLLAGNITDAVIATYYTPLGPYLWWIVVFGTLLITYIKTQSAGITTMIGIVLLFGLRFYLGAVGDFTFYIMLTIGGAILMFQFWNK